MLCQTLFFLISIILTVECQMKICYPSVHGVTGKNACLSGWMSWGGSCYLLTSEQSDWFGAYEACRKMGGVLAAPRSKEEDEFMAGILQARGEKLAWINCSDTEDEGSWKCSVGKEESHFRMWANSEPNAEQQGVDEDCVMINKRGRWGDVRCARSLPSLCLTIQPGLHLLN